MSNQSAIEIRIDRGNFTSNALFLDNTNLLKKDKKILEIGSGTGHLVNYLKERGFDIVGTELRENNINIAKEQFNIDLIKMDGSKLLFDREQFDLVLSFDVLEHIPDVENHLIEVNRVLKNGGYYLLQTPNKITNVLFNIIKDKSFTKYKKYHCSLQSYWGIKKLFKNYGFDINFVKVPIVKDYFITKIRKYFGRIGLILIKVFNPDKLPIFLRTNFYVIAKKIG